MGNDMFNDEQLAHAEIVQKETEDALGFWKDRALKAEAALAALSRARETEDGAVREAAERLRVALAGTAGCNCPWDACDHWRPVTEAAYATANAVLSALSSPPRPAALPLEAPECNDGDDCCRYCGRGLQPCGACKPPAPPADAATEAVREAAERLRSKLGVPSGPILFRHKSGTLHRPDGKIPYGERRAELCDEDGITFAGSEVIEFALMVLDYLDSTPAPAPSAKEGTNA